MVKNHDTSPKSKFTKLNKDENKLQLDRIKELYSPREGKHGLSDY